MSLMSLGLLALLGTSSAHASSAQEPCSAESLECPNDAHRELKDHVFLFPILQSSAFVTSHVGVREGLARYDVPDLPVGDLGTVDVLLTGFQQTLDLGVGITPWLGVEGFARATFVAGANVRSLVSNGASASLLGEVGPVVRVWRNDHSGTQLTVRANFGYQKGNEVTVLPLVRNILDTPGLTLDDVVNGNTGKLLRIRSKEVVLNGGLYLAQSFGSVFSLQASARVGYAWQQREPFDPVSELFITQKTHALRVNLAVALAVDFASLDVPVALMGEYLFGTGRQTETDLPHRTLHSSTIALGVYYTGRPNLQVGLGAVTTLDAEPRRGLGPEGRDAQSGKPTLSYGQLILRYIW
ncbi:hypothetical protein LZ198_13420 [Myxococcus sp. K15C18031901]|uniref:hypothetical protein n=1 Tax=Myxococcus dinghuensis TaxID=2906761 RepID=UPI0020A81539|nr:hypothetical protein [Myxococcus dinghuensis]MCP3099869.1 hypothetical protein [Myxococcus dinghuensis]